VGIDGSPQNGGLIPTMAAPGSRGDPLPFVSVVVPVFDGAESLATLLRALAGQDYPPQRFECIVVDNGSRVPVRAVEGGSFPVRVVREERVGSYSARNRGLAEARGEVLAFTDADCIPRPDWLSCSVRDLGSPVETRVVAGRIEMFPVGGRPRSSLEWRGVLNSLDQARYVADHGFAATANLVTRREVFERVGPFDSDLYSGGDLDWGRRAGALGLALAYCPDAVVRHPAYRGWRATLARARRHVGGFYGLNRSQPRPAWATLAEILRTARDSRRRIRSDPRVPSRSLRSRLLVLDTALRGVQLAELARLHFGGTPRR